MSPTEVTGLWGEARYATNRLSESTEHVLAVARGTQIWRFVVSQPQEVSTWEAPEGLAVLRSWRRLPESSPSDSTTIEAGLEADRSPRIRPRQARSD